MRRYRKVCGCSAAVVFLVAVPAWGATFTYDSLGFESVDAGAQPPGWWTGYTDGSNIVGTSTTIRPSVMTADTANWGTTSILTTGRGFAANAGAVNYAVPWSGAKRFNLLHPGHSTAQRSAEAWYVGTGGPHTGAYPLNLKSNSLRAEFDLSLRSGTSVISTHGFTFAVQPALDTTDFQHWGISSGRLGWGGMNGFSVEVDVYNNNQGVAQANGNGDKDNKHIGVNVARMWDVLGYSVQSMETNVEQVGAIPWNFVQPTGTDLTQSAWCAVGNNNQPLHITVFYNDPAHGGAGVVQVYLYIDPATKTAGETEVPAGQTPFSFGMDGATPKNGGLGELVVDTCIGAWPSEGAVFGFTVGTSGSNAIYQVDNVKVETNAADTSNPCSVAYPVHDPGLTPATVTLADSSVVPLNPPEFDYIANYPGQAAYTVTASPTATSASGLSEPGWTVYTYPDLSWYWNNTPILDYFELSVAYCDLYGLGGPSATSQPEINYFDSGSGGNSQLPLRASFTLPARQTMPGMAAFDNQWFGLLAKGWVYFPPDTGGTNPYPRTYNLCTAGDNGTRLWIGNEVILNADNDGIFRGYNAYHQNSPPSTRGINAGFFRDVTINAPGVYPIQMLYNERTGGAYVELYRRTNDPLVPFLSIGTSKGGLSDQPLVYGKLNGALPATVLTGNPASAGIHNPVVTLDANQRVGDVNAATGSQVFSCKTVWAPKRWAYQGENLADPPPSPLWTAATATQTDMYWGIDEQERTSALRWLDVLQDRSGGATTAVINYGAGYNWSIALNPHADFPGRPTVATDTGLITDNTQFGFRAQGYAVFPAAGTYWVGLQSEESSYLYFGEQVVWSTQYFDQPAKVIQLEVPQAGTYPIRIEFIKGARRTDVPQSRVLILYEVTAGHSMVPVNHALSRIKVYQNCTNPFTWKPHGRVITADRKVAEVGQGVNPGWNGKVVKSSLDLDFIANGTASIENNLYVQDPVNGGGPVRGLEDVDSPEVLNYWDEWDSVDFVCCENIVAGFLPRWSTTARFWKVFGPNGLIPPIVPADPANPGPGNDAFAASFTGYIQFPAPGYYAFNVQAEDTGMMWIGGQVVTLRNYTNGWPIDSQPAVVYVGTPGIYDIRVDYIERDWNAILAAFQILPDGTPVPLNDSAATVQVYRGVSPAPTLTKYHNPTQMQANTKVAPINGGGERGFHMQVVNVTYTNHDGVNKGAGHDNLINIDQAHELLAEALDGVFSPNQEGVKVFDGIVPRIAFNPAANNWTPYPGEIEDEFPGVPLKDWFAARVTGYLGLKKGGHLFVTMNDDGVRIKLGGQVWESGSAKGARGQDVFYVYTPEDGLYPIEIEYVQLWGGAVLSFFEITATSDPQLINVKDAGYRWWEHSPGDGWEVVNDGDTVTKAYVTLCPVPWADSDADGDVDQADFGLLQQCLFTGGSYTATLSGDCTCLDRAGASGPDGAVDQFDVAEFIKCLTGPSVPFLASPPTGCNY